MAIEDLIVKRSDMYQVDPRVLQEAPGWNVRLPGPDLDAHIRFLADSIKEEGVREAVTCYLEGDNLFVTNGHCRLKATMLAISEGAEILSIPMALEDRYSKEPDRVLSMITRNTGKPLTAIETAEVMKRLLRFGWDVAKISIKTGYSVSQIKNFLELSGAPDEILAMVNNGEVSATLATKIVKEKGAAEAVEVLKGAVETSKKSGKKKATQKDIANVKKKKVNWNVFGPKLYLHMKGIYETPATNRNLVFEKIANTGEILGEVEELMGPEDSL
jgi:hypothetical protein